MGLYEEGRRRLLDVEDVLGRLKPGDRIRVALHTGDTADSEYEILAGGDIPQMGGTFKLYRVHREERPVSAQAVPAPPPQPDGPLQWTATRLDKELPDGDRT